MDGIHTRTTPALLFCALLVAGCGPPARPVAEVSTAPDQIPAATPISVAPGDWPWWRGPGRNNVAACESAATSWSDTQNVLWKAPVPGRGHGSPTVVGPHIFLCSADEAAETQNVICLDRASGKELWSTTIHTGGLPGRGEMHPRSTHANCSVACDGSALFVAFLNAEHITATSLTLDGEIRWQQNLGYFGSKFGYAPSPCLFESLAIFAADNSGGGFIAAVHRDSGEIVWRKARNNVDSYSSAITAEINGTTQLLISGDRRVASYDPLSGEENWSCPGTAEATCGTVVWVDNLVFASGGYPERQTVCVDANSGTEVWQDRQKCYEQSMLIANGHLFAVNDDGIALCRDAATGDLKWRQRLGGSFSASPVLAGNLIYATNETGTTWVFEATAEAYREVARNQLGDESFASLTVCDELIYARVASGTGADRQEYLYCLGAPAAQP
ncbi:MAG: PQQ-binding-like beta-propeller repeat protein [Fuerstiella sp.]